MPNYYSDSNASTAFSNGLLAGFEVIDRMKARKRQLDLDEKQEARANEHLTLSKNADKRAGEAHDYGMNRSRVEDTREDETYTHNLERRPILEKAADEQNAAALDATRTNTTATKDAMAERRNTRQAALDYTSQVLGSGETAATPSGASSRPSLKDVAFNQGAPQTTQTGKQESGPIDLRTAQKERDSEPSIFSRMMTFGNERSKRLQDKVHANASKAYWSSIANPGKEEFGRGVQAAEARREPLSILDQYIKERESIDPKDRVNLDHTMRSALTDRSAAVQTQLATLDPSDKRNSAKINALRNESASLSAKQDAFAKTIAASAPKSAGITASVKPSDTRVEQAINTGAAAFANITPSVSPDEMRSINTQLGRISTAKRLTPKQVEVIAKARAYGVIDDQTVMNWRMYGSPLAPQQPKITAIGAGGSIVTYPNGRMAFIEPQGGDKSAGSKVRQGVSDAASLVNSMIAKGDLDLPEKSGEAYITEAISLLGANAPAFQQQTGIRVIGADGNLDLSEILKPQNVRTLIEYRAKAAAGNTDPRESELPIEGAENGAETIPQVGVAKPGTVVMGYRFLGGDPKDERNYVPE